MSAASTTEIWRYQGEAWETNALTGYHVEANDGGIGKIDEATMDAGAGHIVVDTGPWIFGRKVLLPAGTISRVDHDEEKVYVNRTKEHIKNSPEFHDSTSDYDDDYRNDIGAYYGPGGPGWLI
jgi:hypothetical protein